MRKQLLFLQVLMLLAAVFAPQAARAKIYFTTGDEKGNLSVTSIDAPTETNPTVTTLEEEVGTPYLGKYGETTYYYFDKTVDVDKEIAMDENHPDRRIQVRGIVWIILGDGAVVNFKRGIGTNGQTLYITSGGTSASFNGTGTLNADNYHKTNYHGRIYYGPRHPCIGEDYAGTIMGTLVIHGGNVNAVSTAQNDDSFFDGPATPCEPPCIGGGSGTITIDGGKVYAANMRNRTWAAAIGVGRYWRNTMTINIFGGEVTAYSCISNTSYAAGIGSGCDYSYSSTYKLNINITGGKVTAASSKEALGYGAGIGSGYSGWVYDKISKGNPLVPRSINIKISGGDVYAYSCSKGAYGAGIGSGEGHSSSWVGTEKARYPQIDTVSVEITGGKVEAYSCIGKSGDGVYGAGIGSGYDNAAVDIDISGGTIIAGSGKECCGEGAGIGTGKFTTEAFEYFTGLNTANINISGGDILAYSGGGLRSDGKGYGAGIGAGMISNPYNVNVNISGGNVKAYSTFGEGDGGTSGKGYGAGIGNGRENTQVKCTVNISDGTVKAASSLDYIGYGAGIGAGDDNTAGGTVVKISGGTVSACAGENYHGYWAHDGAGIGGGEDGGCDSILISGGNVKAYCSFANGAYMNAAGIGNGEYGEDCKLISITGDETVVQAYGMKAMWAKKSMPRPKTKQPT